MKNVQIICFETPPSSFRLQYLTQNRKSMGTMHCINHEIHEARMIKLKIVRGITSEFRMVKNVKPYIPLL